MKTLTRRQTAAVGLHPQEAVIEAIWWTLNIWMHRPVQLRAMKVNAVLGASLVIALLSVDALGIETIDRFDSTPRRRAPSKSQTRSESANGLRAKLYNERAFVSRMRQEVAKSEDELRSAVKKAKADVAKSLEMIALGNKMLAAGMVWHEGNKLPLSPAEEAFLAGMGISTVTGGVVLAKGVELNRQANLFLTVGAQEAQAGITSKKAKVRAYEKRNVVPLEKKLSSKAKPSPKRSPQSESRGYEPLELNRPDRSHERSGSGAPGPSRDQSSGPSRDHSSHEMTMPALH